MLSKVLPLRNHPFIRILTMRSPAYLFACVLGLLASLSIAIQPIFSSEHKPFTLVAGTIERFNVTLRFSRDVNAYVPTLSLAPLKATEFLLTDGNLTTTYRKRAAFFGDVPDVFPPPLIPLLFGEVIITSPFYVTTDFIIETVFFPSKGFRQQLFSLNGGGLTN